MLSAPTSRRRARGRWSAGAVALVATCAITSGCSGSASSSVPQPTASSAAPSPTPTPSASPVPTVALINYGIVNGPTGFRLPAGLSVVDRIDQANVVTLVLTPASASTLANWLATDLPEQGYSVQGASADSVVFSGPAWSGAFTRSNELAGLTLRKNT